MSDYYTLDELARAIDPHKARRKGNGWMVCCPAHNDNNPSLSLDEKNGMILLHCFAGCTQDEVLDELKARNLWKAGDQSAREKLREAENDKYDEFLKKLKGSVRIFGPVQNVASLACASSVAS